MAVEWEGVLRRQVRILPMHKDLGVTQTQGEYQLQLMPSLQSALSLRLSLFLHLEDESNRPRTGFCKGS